MSGWFSRIQFLFDATHRLRETWKCATFFGVWTRYDRTTTMSIFFPVREKAHFVAGLLVFALAAVVLFGWLTGDVTLTQIRPTFAPMQFNTALCFMLSAWALLLIGTVWQRWAAVPGAILGLFGAVTL